MSEAVGLCSVLMFVRDYMVGAWVCYPGVWEADH